MRAECLAATAKAIGRALTAREATDIEARVRRAMRDEARSDPSGWLAKSMDARLTEAAQAAAKSIAAEAALKKQRVGLQIAATDRIGASISDMQARGIAGLDALDRVIAFHADGKSNVLSIESQSKAIERDALRQMIGTLTASNPKWFGLFENADGVRAIVKAIFGETQDVPAEAISGAKEWATVTTALRERFNRAGGDMGELEDWGLPHHHSQSKVASAGRDEWVAQTLPLLDREHYYNEDGTRMNDAQITDFLNEAWTSIATGGANKVTPGGPRGSGMRANRGSESRQIHYRDADSYLKYQEQYGERSLYEVLVGHIGGISKDIGLVETFGPNPDHAFRFWRDSLVQEGKLAEPTKIGKLDERAIRTENLYNEVSGKTLPVASEYIARTFDTLRNWLVASRLGSAVITSFSDDATLHLTGYLNNLPPMKLIANELAALNPANRVEERMANRAGLAMNTLISALNRFGQNGLGAAFSRRLANTVLRVSGLNAMTEARKRAFGVTMLSSLGGVTKDHARLADLDATDHRILLSKGLTETDFAVWKAAQLEDWGGGNNTMLTPESIYRIPDAKIDNAIGPQIQRLKDTAQAEIDKLNDRNTQDQAWAAKRSDNLRTWVKEQQTKLTQQAAKTDDQTKARLTGLARRLGALYDQIDTANSYFKATKKNQVSLVELRRTGVAEGKSQAATDQVAVALRQAMRDSDSLKAELDSSFVERFAAKEREISQLIERGVDEHRMALALDKFDELFDQANAHLTTRLEKADARFATKIQSAVDEVQAIRGRLQKVDAVWQRANAARPEFSELRAQGVREGRSREASTALKQQMRDITRDVAEAKKEKALDFAESWASRKAELDEFVQRTDERTSRRGPVIDRLQRDIQPAIESARVDAREKAVTKLLGIVLEESDVAVIEPGAKDRAVTGANIQRGTWKGELTRSFFLFKSFPLAMISRHWARGMSSPNVGGRVAYLATLMAATTVAGMVSLQIGEVLKGKDPRTLNPMSKGGVRNWMAALLKGGSLGLYGDFLFSDATQHGQSPFATLSGPVLGTVEDVTNLTQGNIMQALQGKRTDAGAEAVRFVKGNTPGASLWYAKAGFDHLIWNQLAEYFNPGYLARMRTKAQQDYGQRYWWEPQDLAPDRAPDVAAAVH